MHEASRSIRPLRGCSRGGCHSNALFLSLPARRGQPGVSVQTMVTAAAARAERYYRGDVPRLEAASQGQNKKIRGRKRGKRVEYLGVAMLVSGGHFELALFCLLCPYFGVALLFYCFLGCFVYDPASGGKGTTGPIVICVCVCRWRTIIARAGVPPGTERNGNHKKTQDGVSAPRRFLLRRRSGKNKEREYLRKITQYQNSSLACG